MGRRQIRRGNVIGLRLGERLAELKWELDDLLARLHRMSAEPGYEELAELRDDTISKIRHGRRPAYDYEVFAIAEALSVNPTWLANLSDDKERAAGIRRILKQ